MSRERERERGGRERKERERKGQRGGIEGERKKIQLDPDTIRQDANAWSRLLVMEIASTSLENKYTTVGLL